MPSAACARRAHAGLPACTNSCLRGVFLGRPFTLPGWSAEGGCEETAGVLPARRSCSRVGVWFDSPTAACEPSGCAAEADSSVGLIWFRTARGNGAGTCSFEQGWEEATTDRLLRLCQQNGSWAFPHARPLCIATCGDGVVVGGEGCDDGNLDPRDGCPADCSQPGPGYNCTRNIARRPGAPASGCDFACGDGVAVGAEACDDGNTLPSDGCGEDCRLEQPRAAPLWVACSQNGRGCASPTLLACLVSVAALCAGFAAGRCRRRVDGRRRVYRCDASGEKLAFGDWYSQIGVHRDLSGSEWFKLPADQRKLYLRVNDEADLLIANGGSISCFEHAAMCCSRPHHHSLLVESGSDSDASSSTSSSGSEDAARPQERQPLAGAAGGALSEDSSESVGEFTQAFKAEFMAKFENAMSVV